MAENIEPLEISAILPSTVLSQSTASDYYSDSESYISENNITSEGAELSRPHDPSRQGKQHKSIHVQRTPLHPVEPTIIPTTYASFRLSVSKVMLTFNVCKMSP